MHSHILHLFSRTPVHIGSGASVGAIDKTIQRERHTGLPFIPASSMKGSFADHWNDQLQTSTDGKGKTRRIRGASEAAWLFGSDDAESAFAGSLLFGEGRLLAFPIRSAKGGYAWITSPLMLHRAVRDGVVALDAVPPEPRDDEAIFKADGPLALGSGAKQIVLEEYAFAACRTPYPAALAAALACLVSDTLFQSITDRLVILNDGMMSHFATTACEIAQHVRISDETGTADPGGLFNQENVPADTLFYALVGATKSRVTGGAFHGRTAADAIATFQAKIDQVGVFQFGADATTGLGYCSATLTPRKGA